MKLQHNQTLLFTGDSITDCGRGWPVGRDDMLGDGYVSWVDSILAAGRPERHITILNTGISGNRVTDLASRWRQDVLKHEPDWLAIMIGINDVWRQFDQPHDRMQVRIDLYEETYKKLLDRTRERLHGLVLMSPYMIESNPREPMRQSMDAYGRVVRKLAEDHQAIFVDVQAAFDRYLSHRPAHSLCEDRIHPNRTGHMIIAQAFLDQIQHTPGDHF